MFRSSVEFLLSDKWFIFKEKTIFFFFSIFSGQKKIYIENKGKTTISLILYFSKKKKKKKK